MEDNRISVDEYFMNLAKETSYRSRDTHTKVGACIIKDNKILSLGYNGAPRLFDDSLIPMSNTDINSDSLLEQKNTYMIHAEVNAILNYGGILSDLKNSTIYTTVSPCHECAKVLAQVGIKKIIYLQKYHRTNICEASEYILKQCGIEIEQFNKKGN